MERLPLHVVDPELADAIPADERPLAERHVALEIRRPVVGDWEPDPRGADGGTAFALLVLSGAITREVCLVDRRSAELFGPGDVLGLTEATDALLPHEVRWNVTDGAAVALLDERFRVAARRWPALGIVLQDRLFEQAGRVAVHVAIAQLGRVEQRVLALFWHLAERWGRVTPHGVHVPLRLTHAALGRLVGAQRPTVTLALVELGKAGRVTRLESGGWLLDPASRELLATERSAGGRRAVREPQPIG